MRSLAFVLALFIVAGAVAGWKPPSSPEIDRTTAMAEASHKAAKSWSVDLRRELQRHSWDAWAAAEKRAPRYRLKPIPLYRTYAAVAFIEGRWRVKLTHDDGLGWGTIGMQERAVVAAAKRIGVLGKKPTNEQRRRVWERFSRDPAFTVLVGVDHVAWIVAEKPDILPALIRHNCHVCTEFDRNSAKYGGSLLYWHRLLWRENLPFSLALPEPTAVGSGLR